MAQNFTSDLFDPNFNVEVTLTNMQFNFISLRSNNSGSAELPYYGIGTTWYKEGTNESFRVRNSVNSAWLAILIGDSQQNMWVYKNTASVGWTINENIFDKVLSLKGGQYGVSAGQLNGSWSQTPHTHGATGLTLSHRHTVTLDTRAVGLTAFPQTPGYIVKRLDQNDPPDDVNITDAVGTGFTGVGATPNTWRPAAAVGTIQKPNLIIGG